MPKIYDVIVIGAGAAGLMCAAQAGQRGRSTLVLEHNAAVGKKILLSGGGRCNFTHLQAAPEHYLSQNPHFCKSALSRYSPYDFVKLVDDYGIAHCEKSPGQLFCTHSAKDIIELLQGECAKGQVEIRTQSSVQSIQQLANGFLLHCGERDYRCQSLVIATGALSFPRLGASDFGHRIARQFGLALTPLRPGLVPFTFDKTLREQYQALAGIALPATASCNGQQFRDQLLFTHKGLSGPLILQISSYWQAGQSVALDLLPDHDLVAFIQTQKQQHPRQNLKTVLSELLPKRFAEQLCQQLQLHEQQLGNLTNKQLTALRKQLQPWQLTPAGDEGYRKAEVTLGGVDTRELSSQTLEAKKVKGLYFIGEVVDVTGQLGGFNFQWAWASGYCAGQYA